MLITEYDERLYRENLLKEGYEAGEAQGIARGKAEGKAEGIAEGKAEGIAEGKAEGIAEGKAEGLIETAVRMVKKGLDISLIAEVTGLAQSQIDELVGAEA